MSPTMRGVRAGLDQFLNIAAKVGAPVDIHTKSGWHFDSVTITGSDDGAIEVAQGDRLFVIDSGSIEWAVRSDGSSQ